MPRGLQVVPHFLGAFASEALVEQMIQKEGWHPPVYSGTGTVDGIHFKRPGLLYRNTTEKQLYMWNGNRWAPVAGGPGTEAYLPPTERFVDCHAPTDGNGAREKPFRRIQAAVDAIEAACNPSGWNPFVVRIAHGAYPENVSIRRPGVSLRGAGSGGGDGLTLICPLQGPAIQLTNAFADSIMLYRETGAYTDLVTQGNAGPQDFTVSDLCCVSLGINAYAVEALGAPRDAGKGLTAFCGGEVLLQGHLNNVSVLGSAGGFFLRNVVAMTLDRCRDAGSPVALRAINCNALSLPHADLAAGLELSYDPEDPAGRPVGAQIGLVGLMSQIAGPVRLQDEAVARLKSCHLGDLGLADTTDLVIEGGYVGGDIDVDGTASLLMQGVHAQGGLAIDPGAGMVRMDGGSLMGELADPSDKLIRNRGL
jgi:hypothetical protein